jgi:hypothetical protein
MPAPRLLPLVAEFDFACGRLLHRLAGPEVDSGNGTPVPVPVMTDDEYLWEPVAGCWSIRQKSDGSAIGATELIGAGDWGRDWAPPPHLWPPPFTTIAWRLGHVSEMLSIRADHLIGTHAASREEYRFFGTADGGIAAFNDGVRSWRAVLAGAGDEDLDVAGRSTYPYGSDPEDPLVTTVWWVNQEVLHHGAEIALLRDLYGATHR